MENFIIRSYGLQELALCYFPHCQPHSASNQLRRWMLHPMLLAKLTDAGYHSGQKILTPRQVRVIVEHLGEP